tara:strand:+ start:2680 stop:3753 length:1074 start_codon:yes stop_codon:yes gene_type:complete
MISDNVLGDIPSIDTPIDRAVALGLNGYTDEAQKLLREYPDQQDPSVVFNLGWYDLFNGNLSKGMKALDAGRIVECYGSQPLPGPIWRDEPLEGKTILFHCEGGIGDNIIHFRFAQDFRDMGAQVVISCNVGLARLFNQHGFITVSNQNPQIAPYIYYDFWIPAMSAGHILNYEYDTLSGKPYLFSPARNLPSKLNSLKVGIRWSGNPQFAHEDLRQFPRELMFDLLSIENVTFYSLQRDADLVSDLPLIDLKDEMVDFSETAKIIMGLDLVITSCTSIAHCAAALGVETWVVIPLLPYYVWALQGDTSPWYNSVKLYRQEVFREWHQPFENIKRDLINKTSALNMEKKIESHLVAK